MPQFASSGPRPVRLAPGRSSLSGPPRHRSSSENVRVLDLDQTRGRRPMARPDKAAAVAELTEKFQSSSAAVLTEYRGLTVAQLTKLRQAISEHATYAVVKNTLTDIAA